ncbi:VPS10 domain-containing receptor SorCS1-like [Oncorhynchus tshawytscha]|uniref:VPS10 domain-containing receptor SorCS1-like n=1 Tax=Oncorhynchus tshawytscha TaxID=74940 RepID=UPI001C3D201C|nr:VPS10 domain-containing receptor SorCS1-like [Oncorhynchus tshawytscha]
MAAADTFVQFANKKIKEQDEDTELEEVEATLPQKGSTDYGSTYERMNDKVGSKTVLSYLYVCPSNKRKIMVLTDPEIESSVLISSDERVSYQKYRLSFYILILLFHPTQEDWALGYNHDQKLYASLDFGSKYPLVHEHVKRFYWSVTGLDKESDLVNMEPDLVTPNTYSAACLQPQPIRYIIAAVPEWNQKDTYNLYLSDTLAMENVKTNQMLDLYEVAGIKGMLVDNRRLDNQVKIYITYNKGRDWRFLQAPATGLAGNNTHCFQPFCSLRLQLQTSENPYVSGSISTKASAPGIIVATGNIESELVDIDHILYVICYSDYGYERRREGNCLPAFWFNPAVVSRSCSQGQKYLISTGYRKVVSNNCTKGVKDMYTPRKQMCPNRAPKGLSFSTREGKLTADLLTNVTFLVHLDESESSTSESSSVFVSGPVEHVQLLAAFVAIKNKAVNLTAVVWPIHSRTLTYFWWLGNSSEPVISLDGRISYTFTSEGMNNVTVQVSSANTILQDTKTIAVQGKDQYYLSLSDLPNQIILPDVMLINTYSSHLTWYATFEGTLHLSMSGYMRRGHFPNYLKKHLCDQSSPLVKP